MYILHPESTITGMNLGALTKDVYLSITPPQ